MFRSPLAANFRAAQPVWSKWLGWLVAVPCWIAWGIAIFRSMNGEPLPVWGWLAFMTFGAVAVIQWMFYLHKKPD